MRKQHLLVAASALLFGLGGTNYAFADGYGNHNQDPTTASQNTLAASIQAGEVEDNFAKGTDATNSISGSSFNGAKGMFNVQQNGGANSLQQSDNTLAAILNCTCSTPTAGVNTSTGAIALSAQVASVEDNVSIGTVNKSETVASSEQGGGQHSSSSTSNGSSNGNSDPTTSSYNGANGGSGGATAGKGTTYSSTNTDTGGGWNSEAFYKLETTTAVASSNGIDNAFNGAVGMFNVSQNVGNNSMQQASNTAAAIIGK